MPEKIFDRPQREGAGPKRPHERYSIGSIYTARLSAAAARNAWVRKQPDRCQPVCAVDRCRRTRAARVIEAERVALHFLRVPSKCLRVIATLPRPEERVDDLRRRAQS